MGMTHSTIRRSGCIVSSYQRRFPVVYLLGGQCEGLELRIGNSRSALCLSGDSFLSFYPIQQSSGSVATSVDRQYGLSIDCLWYVVTIRKVLNIRKFDLIKTGKRNE